MERALQVMPVGLSLDPTVVPSMSHVRIRMSHVLKLCSLAHEFVPIFGTLAIAIG